ncbi:MAG TPA: hypothetical protein VFC63_10000 [Blastocatellia bacterium]|nr:hypothetical protein [Blastocatellia bacterium]
MLQQFVSIAAAAMILIAYAANHLKWLDRDSVLYILLNLFGSAILAVIAARAPQASAGLVAVEGSWAIISLFALIKVLVSGEEPAEEFH